MKYQTIVFDVNKPTLKQVEVPLDSAYGLAIRVVKDGQVVPLVAQGDIVVDGQDSVGLKNTWQLFELSSGSEPQTKTLSVEAHAPKGSIHYGMVGTETLVNEQPFPIGMYADFPLSDAGLGDFARLDALSTEMQAWFAGQQLTSIADLLVSPEGKSALSDMYYLNTYAAPRVWVNCWLTA